MDVINAPATSPADGPTTGVVLQLHTPFRQRTKAARQSAILQRFAETRRHSGDVFWLKENAEILNVFESTGAALSDQALSVYADFYGDIEHRIGFFPQYYRFFLSLCLDAEDLGMAGDKGALLAEWVAAHGFPAAELSDLQRAEARRLCLRRGVDAISGEPGLDDRLRAFTRRSDTFALPNKKAAYELTHILFYLSEYGRCDPLVDEQTLSSLYFAGTLAFLELNIDLLAEICIAMRFAGHTPPDTWEVWLSDQTRRFDVVEADGPVAHDAYHPWLMLNWFMELSDRGGFGQELPEGGVQFIAPTPSAGPLRELSDSIYKMGDQRSAHWDAMRDQVGESLSDESRTVLAAAETAVDFGAFFEGFARATVPGMAH